MKMRIKLKIENIFKDGVEYKCCTRCGNYLPADNNYFSKDRRAYDGLISACKSCLKARWYKYKEFVWSETDIELLKQLYHKYTIQTISIRLGISRTSISLKAKQLGLETVKYRNKRRD